MRTRGVARREDEAAAAVAAAATPAARHAALIPLLSGPPHVLAAALAAIGPPGSTPLLAALAFSDHTLLRAACSPERLDAIPPLLRAYGESPGACADVIRVLDDADDRSNTHHNSPRPLRAALTKGHAGAMAALLGAYRHAGRSAEALASDDHWALRRSAEHPEILRLLLAEYGAPGGPALLRALAAGSHYALRVVCRRGQARTVALLLASYGPPECRDVLEALEKSKVLAQSCVNGRAELVALLAAAYGESGRPALRKALAEDEDGFRMTALLTIFSRIHLFFDHDVALLAAYDATLAAALAALGEPEHTTALRALGDWLKASNRIMYGPAERLARVLPDSVLARLAAQSPAAWAVLADGTARALLSAPVRASLALPALLALRRLPEGVAEPLAAFLRARPWLLFYSSCIAAAPAAAAAAAAAAPAAGPV